MFVPIGELAHKGDGPAGEEDDSTAGALRTLPSICPACEETGLTRMLLTRIPFFRDIILISFECEECGHRNWEVQPSQYQDKGCRFEVKVKSDAVSGRRRERGAKLSLSAEMCFTLNTNLLFGGSSNKASTRLGDAATAFVQLAPLCAPSLHCYPTALHLPSSLHRT